MLGFMNTTQSFSASALTPGPTCRGNEGVGQVRGLRPVGWGGVGWGRQHPGAICTSVFQAGGGSGLTRPHHLGHSSTGMHCSGLHD